MCDHTGRHRVYHQTVVEIVTPKMIPMDRIRHGLKHWMEGYYSFVLKLRTPLKCIFVLAHMRSGSYLLVHLLSANRDVCGFRETHIDYRTKHDLSRLSYWVPYKLRRFPLPGRETYVLDKIVHDSHLRIDDLPVLCARDVKVIFLIRDPRGALRSLMESLNYDSHRAVRYYCDRLSTLAQYARCFAESGSCALITYEHMLWRTEEVFGLLESYLELEHPLSEQYPLLRTTGAAGVGDFSAKLFSGQICRDATRVTMPAMEAGLSEEAMEAFQTCLRIMVRCCITADQVDGLPSCDA